MRNDPQTPPVGADPLFVSHLANAVTSSGSVPISEVVKGGRLTANSYYPGQDPQVPATSEAKDETLPVAGGMDWFRFAAELCHTPLAEKLRIIEGVDRG